MLIVGIAVEVSGIVAAVEEVITILGEVTVFGGFGVDGITFILHNKYF